MTLEEMADHICERSGYLETDDVAAAKVFLSKRHELIWNDQLWKDALVEYVQTLSPDGYTLDATWLPETGVLLLPKIIKQVVAVRTGDMSLRVERPEYYLRVDGDVFANTGLPVNFTVLPPVVWQLDAARSLKLARSDEADNTVVVTVDTQAEDSIEVARQSVTLAEADNDLAVTAQVDAIGKAATTGTVALGAYGQMTVSGADYEDANGVYTQEGESGGRPLYIRRVAGEIVGRIYWVAGYPSGDSWLLSVVVSGYGTLLLYYAVGDVALPDDATGWAVAPLLPITVTTGPTSIVGDEDIDLVTLAAGDKSAEKRQRIRLIWRPAEEVTVRVLGKRRCPTFTADNDEPAINGMELCLMAFAEGDLLRRAGENGKAQGLYEEAIGLLEQLKRLETTQQAHAVRISVEGDVSPQFYGVGPWY